MLKVANSGNLLSLKSTRHIIMTKKVVVPLWLSFLLGMMRKTTTPIPQFCGIGDLFDLNNNVLARQI